MKAKKEGMGWIILRNLLILMTFPDSVSAVFGCHQLF